RHLDLDAIRKSLLTECPGCRYVIPPAELFLLLRAGDTPKAVRAALWKRCEIASIELFNLEIALLDKGRDVTGNVAAFKCPMKERLRSFLPAPYGSVRCKSVLEENELASGLQHTSDALNGFQDKRNGAESERAYG